MKPEGFPQNTPKQEKELPLGRLDQPLAEYFKENGIEVPPVDITVCFSRHLTKEDADWIEPYYKDTDIYVPELADWNEGTLDLFRKVASGDAEAKITADKFVSERSAGFKSYVQPDNLNEFENERIRIIERNPGKEIIFVDIPSGTDLALRFEKSNSGEAFFEEMKKINSALPRLKDIAKANNIIGQNFAEVNKEREKLIIESLPKRIGEVVKNNPQLSSKENLKVLIQLGTLHTTVYHKLKMRGENVRELFKDGSSFRFPIFEGGLSYRRTMFGKPLTEEESQKVLFAQNIRILHLIEASNFLSENEFDEYTQYVVSKFSLEEMNKIYRDYVTINTESLQKSFQRTMRAKGLPIIKTAEDAEKFRESLKNKNK